MLHNSPEIAIIGAGPAGLFAVYACGMLGYRCYLFDLQETLGGQCVLYLDKPIYDIPGFQNVSARDLIENLKMQHAPFRPEYRLGERVTIVESIDGGFRVGTKSESVEVRAVIVAGGIGAFGPRKPPLPNIQDFEGSSVFYSVDDIARFKDKNVVIAGGGDSAVDWAIELSKIARSVHLVHRRSEFRCHESSARQLACLIDEGKVVLEAPYQVVKLVGEKSTLAQVVLENIKDQTQKEVACDFFLPFFGLSASLGDILQWDLNIKKEMIPVDIETMSTARPGIYAIGDIAEYVNKPKLIAVGFAEAVRAVYAMRQYLNPGKSFHFEYSTTQGVKPL